MKKVLWSVLAVMLLALAVVVLTVDVAQAATVSQCGAHRWSTSTQMWWTYCYRDVNFWEWASGMRGGWLWLPGWR